MYKYTHAHAHACTHRVIETPFSAIHRKSGAKLLRWQKSIGKPTNIKMFMCHLLFSYYLNSTSPNNPYDVKTYMLSYQIDVKQEPQLRIELHQHVILDLALHLYAILHMNLNIEFESRVNLNLN